MTYSTHSLRYCGKTEIREAVYSIWATFGRGRFTFGDLVKVDGLSEIKPPTLRKLKNENVLRKRGCEIVRGKKSTYYTLSPSTIEYIRDYYEGSSKSDN